MATILEPALTAHIGDESITVSAVPRLGWGLGINEGILLLAVAFAMELRDITESVAWMISLSTNPRAAALDWDNASVWALRSDIIAALAIQQEFGTAVGVNTASIAKVQPFGNMVDQGYLITRDMTLILDETNGTAGGLTYSVELLYKRVRLTDAEIGNAIVSRGR